MRKIILLTVFLFISAISITAFYFSGLQLPGQKTANVISQIPADAALVFEFKNDREFYDLFKDNTLLTSFIGQKKASQLAYLQHNLFKNFVNEQSIFVSLHPKINTENIGLLLTTNSDEQFNLLKITEQNIGITTTKKVGNNQLTIINFNAINEVFYICQKAEVLAGSFDKNLLISFLKEKKEADTEIFKQLSDQQNRNSIANLYVNYRQLPTLMNQLFQSQNNPFLKLLNGFAASASLSLNYKSDALFFNGYTQTDTSVASYSNLFLHQQPVKNWLKNIYPQNTATAVGFAISNPKAFFDELDRWQNKEFHQSKSLFNQLKKETGISVQTTFRKQLGNEFAAITTAENENLAIIQLKNGTETASILQNLSINPDAAVLRFKYVNLPFYLLGEPLRTFKQPYFLVLDNLLFLAETESGLNHYLNQYHQQKFLNTSQQFLRFDALQPAQSNISFFADFENANTVLKNTLRPNFAGSLNQKSTGWNNCYAMALQLAASDHGFYTNYYLQQKQRDTTNLRTINL